MIKNIFLLLLMGAIGFVLYSTYVFTHELYSCDTNKHFTFEAQAKIKLKDSAIVAYDFKESYVRRPEFKHIMELEDTEHAVGKDQKINFKFINYNNEKILTVEKCENYFGPPPNLYLKDESAETYIVSFYNFRKFHFEKIQK